LKQIVYLHVQPGTKIAIFVSTTLSGSWSNWRLCSMWRPLLLSPSKKVNSV